MFCSASVTHSAGRREAGGTWASRRQSFWMPRKMRPLRMRQRSWSAHFLRARASGSGGGQASLHELSVRRTLHPTRRAQTCVRALVLSVYPVTNTNISTHSQPVDRLCKLHWKTSSKCLQNMEGEDGDFFTAVLGLLFGGLKAWHSGGICWVCCSWNLFHSLNKVL